VAPADACALLAADEDARAIAGGQTLVPMLAMRLARPTKLIDIYRLPELHGIVGDGEGLGTDVVEGSWLHRASLCGRAG
jgi:CO/xanthine dehydrogenase FAD-binding subunit